jgi:hypothetical protein
MLLIQRPGMADTSVVHICPGHRARVHNFTGSVRVRELRSDISTLMPSSVGKRLPREPPRTVARRHGGPMGWKMEIRATGCDCRT